MIDMYIIIFIGSICPGGYLNTHTYVTWEKESDLDSYASKFAIYLIVRCSFKV